MREKEENEFGRSFWGWGGLWELGKIASVTRTSLTVRLSEIPNLADGFKGQFWIPECLRVFECFERR